MGKEAFVQVIATGESARKEWCTEAQNDVLVLVLIKDALTIKRMLTTRHPCTRDLFLYQRNIKYLTTEPRKYLTKKLSLYKYVLFLNMERFFV